MTRRIPLTLLALAGALAAALSAVPTRAQDAPERGLRVVDPRWHALVHAKLTSAPGESLEDATIVLRDGVIVSVAAGAAPPEGARVWDCTGLEVHAGFVEPYLAVDAPRRGSEGTGEHWQHELVTPERNALDGTGVDASVAKELRALGFTAAAISPRGGVFRGSAAIVALSDGGDDLSAAGGVVITPRAYQAFAFDRGGFGGGAIGYPSSEMGAIALIRQTWLDADRHALACEIHAAAPAKCELPAPNLALEALSRRSAGKYLFEARNELQTLRAAKLAAEFGRPVFVLGSGTEYRRLEAIAATGLPIVVPLAFDPEPDVSTHAKAEAVSLRDLMAFEQAPTNPRRLVERGVTAALTTHQLDARGDFRANLLAAIEHGLSEEDALAMLTTVPAQLLDVGDRVGRVAPGLLAHLVVTDGPLFAKDTKVREVWVAGKRHAVEAAAPRDPSGTYAVTFSRLGDAREVAATLVIDEREKVELRLAGAPEPAPAEPQPEGSEPREPRPRESLPRESEPRERGERAPGVSGVSGVAPEPERAPKRGGIEARKVHFSRNGVHFLLDGAALGVEGTLSVSAILEDDTLYGSLVGQDGIPYPWRGVRTPGADEASEAGEKAEAGDAGETVEAGDSKESAPEASGAAKDASDVSKDASDAASVPATLGLPFGAYASRGLPPVEALRIEGATLWTSGPLGIVEDGVLVVAGGKVVHAGPREGAPPADPSHATIDARGKHVTPGLIDCHSHTGVSGSVNEGGERVTAEVRIADVIDPDSISFYNQIAGGLTAANQLHGSANAIGGQNSVVKLRWGVAHPDEMRLAGAPGGIKFALGENPKRVAAGTSRPDEYPQTRLGVEALIRDRLTAGRDYNAAWRNYRALSEWERRTTMPPRRDLELEALGEIVAGTRWIHCHSYRQDEILMLADMVEELGIRIGTFQHVLEGYKVAEAVKRSARGASSFADWWAYKFEVIDAIPDNAAILHEVGVVVSINSDSDEFARRLNTEAAKGVKYGGMSPHEALKMVTLNPAIQLGVEDRVGSLEPGKDADFVLWSGDPLSYYSRCEATWIDGRRYFSLERDAELRAEAASERQRIVQKILRSGEREGRERPRARTPRVLPILASGQMTLREAYDAGYRDEIEALWRAGIDPGSARPGDCGCDEIIFALRSSTGAMEGSR